uniref:Mitofilin n=1 Tax=Ciona savignyi TaxID=51511 RepID=H2Y9M6_CIOSA
QTHHQVVHKSKRNFASQPSPGSKTLILVTGALLGGAGGTVAFCKYDPKFRASLESNAPAVKPLLLTILGPQVESVEPAPTRKIKST